MKFRAVLQLDGKTATGITVPNEVLESLGGGRRPAVAVTINGHTYRTTVGIRNSEAKIPVSAAVREATGTKAGDSLTVEIVRDDAPRVVEPPADLAARLAAHPSAKSFFERLSPSRQREYVTWIEQAKRPETRLRRLDEAIERLAAQHTR